jgi:hypothetical protein
LNFSAKQATDLSTGGAPRKQGFSRHILILFFRSGIPVPLCFSHLIRWFAAHKFLKLITMKKHFFKTEKSLWQEFVEYLASIYWQGAENDLEEQTITFEYQQFIQTMAS